MAHRKAKIRSAKRNEMRRLMNRAKRSALRTQLKNTRQAIGASSEDCAEQLRLAASSLDKAGKTRIIHPNKAARLKSRLAKAANAASAQAAAAES